MRRTRKLLNTFILVNLLLGTLVLGTFSNDSTQGVKAGLTSQSLSADRIPPLPRESEYRYAAQQDSEAFQWRLVDFLNTRHSQISHSAKSSNVGCSTDGTCSKNSGYVWYLLAGCETGGRYDNPNTGNGFYGYFQFSLSTWKSLGGTGYPHEHSYDIQRSFASKLQSKSGWGQWPKCGCQLKLNTPSNCAKLGYRYG